MRRTVLLRRAVKLVRPDSHVLAANCSCHEPEPPVPRVYVSRSGCRGGSGITWCGEKPVMMSLRCLLTLTRLSRRNLAVGCATLGCALAGCTDPTAVGPKPDFLAMVSGALGPTPSLLDRLSPDSCPKLTPATTPTAGQPVPEIGATIGVPRSSGVSVASFGPIPGAAYRVSNLGFIVIGFDDYFAVRERLLFLGGPVGIRSGSPSDSFLTSGPPYDRWCNTTLSGRPATIRLALLTPFDSAGRPQPSTYLNDMAVVATSPTGRKVNIRIFSDGPVGTAGPAFQQLLTMVATWTW